MEGICERIEALLKERGISGSRMSADLGMSRSFMTELRKGRAKGVSAENAARIAEYLGVSTDYLLGNAEREERRATRSWPSILRSSRTGPTSACSFRLRRTRRRRR